jgi:hypothetical protein
VTQYPNRRNPIVRHGEVGRQFVQIPNALARDTALSLHAYKIAILLRTHRQGWEVSRKSLADTYGWGRTSVAKAMAELVEAGWLALREYRNENGHRLFEEFHVHVSRAFSQEESAQIGTTVTLTARHAPGECIQVHPFVAGDCRRIGSRACTG